MAGENEIVIPISADITKLIEQINKLTGDVEELKSAGQEAGNYIKKAFVGAETAVDGTTKAYQELEKEINDVKNAMKGQRDPKVIANLKQYISELQKEQTELINTGKAFVNLSTQIKVVRDEMAFLIANGQKGTQRFRELSVQLGTLSDRRKDIQELGNVIGGDTRKFDTFAQAVGGVAAAFSVYQSVMALVGSENKDFQKTMTKVMGAMAVANGVHQIANMLQKESPVMLALMDLRTKFLTSSIIKKTAATTADTTAQMANNVATNQGTKATTALTGTIGAGSGVVAVWGAALIAAVATMVNYVKWITTATKRTDEYNLTVETASTNLAMHREKVTELSTEVNNYIKKLYESGKSEKQQIRDKIELAKTEAEAGQKNIQQKISASQTEIDLLIAQNTELQKTIDNKNLSQTTIQAALNQQSKNIEAINQERENQKQLNNELKAGKELITTIYPEKLKQIEAAEKYAESVKKQTEELLKLIELRKKVFKGWEKDIANTELLYRENSKKIIEYFVKEEDKILKESLKLKSNNVDDLKKLDDQRFMDSQNYWQLVLENDKKNINAQIQLEELRYQKELKEKGKTTDLIEEIERKHQNKINEIRKEGSKTFWDEYVEDITKWTNVATQAIGVLFSAMSVSSDNALTEIDKNFTSQEARYKDMLDRQVISQEQYDAKVSQLEKEKAAKEKKIKHDAFEQERTAKIINATISGLVGALAQYEAGTAGWVLSASVGALAAANIALIASEKNPYRKGTAQILGGRSHEQGGVSLGSFGEAEQGEFLGILSKRQTATYGNGLMNLFEGLNKNNKDKVLTGLTDIASNVGFSDTNTNLSVSLNEVREIKSIEKMMKSGNTSVTYHNGYREEKSKGLIRRVYV